MIDGVTQASNLAVHPEIDIISLEKNESFVAVIFQDTPILHIDNFYDFIVYWNGDQNANFTDDHCNQGHIISQTKLVNSTSGIIVNTKINNTIEMFGNTIYYPILNASLITTDLEPINANMDTRHRNNGTDFYRDVLEYITRNVPRFIFLLSIVGITTFAMTIIMTKKKKERKN